MMTNTNDLFREKRSKVINAASAYYNASQDLGSLSTKHKIILSSLSENDLNNGKYEKIRNEQEKDIIVLKQHVMDTYTKYKSAQRELSPEIVSAFGDYSDSDYKVGTIMLLRMDQMACDPDADLSNCGYGEEKKFMKVFSCLWDRATVPNWYSDMPNIGLSFRHLPYPLEADSCAPYPVLPKDWYDMNYAADSNDSSFMPIGITGYNGTASFSINFGFDVNDPSPCGAELYAESMLEGVVDIGGTGDYCCPNIEITRNIYIYQYRGLGAPISEIYGVYTAPVYKAWRALFHIGPTIFEDNPVIQPQQLETITIHTPGLHAIKPITAKLYKSITDIQHGDSFIFKYEGWVAAYASSLDFTYNGIGSWLLRKPILKVYQYPGSGLGNYNWVTYNNP